MDTTILLIIIGALVALFVAYYTWVNNKYGMRDGKLDTLLEYVEADKKEKEAEQELKDAVREQKREKLETFKRTKDELRERLRAKFDAVEWQPLHGFLDRVDKGHIGTYVLYNKSKNKYYVGQAKETYKRIRDHFKVEQIALDKMAGDEIVVKILSPTHAAELYNDYRIDHIEKSAIEVFDGNTTGYNRTTGNL